MWSVLGTFPWLNIILVDGAPSKPQTKAFAVADEVQQASQSGGSHRSLLLRWTLKEDAPGGQMPRNP